MAVLGKINIKTIKYNGITYIRNLNKIATEIINGMAKGTPKEIFTWIFKMDLIYFTQKFTNKMLNTFKSNLRKKSHFFAKGIFEENAEAKSEGIILGILKKNVEKKSPKESLGFL